MKPMTTAEVKQISDLHAQGMNSAEIARKIGRSQVTVWKRVKRLKKLSAAAVKPISIESSQVPAPMNFPMEKLSELARLTEQLNAVNWISNSNLTMDAKLSCIRTLVN